jgi:hypothetical protein
MAADYCIIWQRDLPKCILCLIYYQYKYNQAICRKRFSTMKSTVAAWILPDQLLPADQHPALAEAVHLAGGHQKNVRVVLIVSRRHYAALPFYMSVH